MSINFYKVVHQANVKHLNTLLHLLDKAKHFCEENKVSEEAVVNARLAIDMFPFKKQIQMVTDMSVRAVARLTDSELPTFEDNENSIAELQARVKKALEFLQKFNAQSFNGTEKLQIQLPYFDKPMTAENFALQFAVPNVAFHTTTAYLILRHNGVKIGKKDFLGTIDLL